MFLRDLTTQIAKPIIATNKTTGSASIKMGIVPDVRVTSDDRNRTRQTPDDKIINPDCSWGFMRAITLVIRQIATPISR